MTPPIIQFDYEFSPYGHKVKLLLTLLGVKYSRCDQPIALPREDLEAMGITYRRIPLLAIGKDIYADTSLIVDVILSKLGTIPHTMADKAFEAWGNVTFHQVLPLCPSSLLQPELVKDRQTIFPVLARPDFESLRPSALGALKSRLMEVEERFLGNSHGPFMGGGQLSMADVHVIFAIRWCLIELGVNDQEPGFGPDIFPKLWKVIDSLPETKPPIVSSENAIKTVSEAEFWDSNVSVDGNDPLGLAMGTQVTIESTDSEPGSHPQIGKLLGVSANEVVIEVAHQIRLHLPRIGYTVRPA